METNKRQRGVESESSSSESRASSSSSSSNSSIACDGAAPTTSSNSDTGSAEMSTNDDTVCASPDFFAARHPSWIPPPPQRPVPNVSIGLPTAQAFTNAVAAYDRHHQCAAPHGNDDEKATGVADVRVKAETALELTLQTLSPRPSVVNLRWWPHARTKGLSLFRGEIR